MAAAVQVEGSADESENSQGPKLIDPAIRETGPKRRSTVGGWTSELDMLLMEAYNKCQGKPWKKIAEMVPGKTHVQCLHRYQKVLHPSVHKGPWTQEEDKLLSALVEKLGDKKWSKIAKDLPGRIGKQCRERWNNHLKPSINRSPWTKEEDTIIMRAHHENGSKWAEIAKLLPGRTENSIKNRWHCCLKKKPIILGNQPRLNDQLAFEGYPVMPLCEYKRNEDLKHDSSLSSGMSYRREMGLHGTQELNEQNKEETHGRPINVRVVSSHGSQSGMPNGYFMSPLVRVCRAAGQQPGEPHGNLHCLPDCEFCRQSTNMTTPASQVTSLASPVNQKEIFSTHAGSPEAILRSKATTYKYMPSIIRKRHIEASPGTTPCNKSRKAEISGVKLACSQQLNTEAELEVEPVSTELTLSLPSQPPKLDVHIGRNRPVEKCLEKEFNAVWDSSGKR